MMVAEVKKTEAEDGATVVTAEIVSGDVRSCPLAGDSGGDSPPLAGDKVVLVRIDGTGRFVAVGVLGESQGAKPGERILYSRSSDGALMAAVRLLGDGKIEMVSPESLSVSGKSVSVRADDAAEVGGKSLRLESSETTLTGGKVRCAGAVSPTGQGPFCGMPYCAFTGAPQSGAEVSGT